MKKTLAMLLAGIIASAFIVGCSKPAEGDPAATTGTTAETGTTPKTTEGTE